MPKIIVAVWIYLCGLVGAVTTGAFLAQVLSMYPRPVEPAVSRMYADKLANAPAWLWGSAAISAVLGIYLWRSRRRLETRLFAATVIAAINLLLAMHFAVALLVSYFYLPKLASGDASVMAAAERESNVDPACIRLVERHVAETRGWDVESYEVREESSDLGGRGFSVWHESDRAMKMPGGQAKSFHLEVDLDCRMVVKELHYQ